MHYPNFIVSVQMEDFISYEGVKNKGHPNILTLTVPLAVSHILSLPSESLDTARPPDVTSIE